MKRWHLYLLLVVLGVGMAAYPIVAKWDAPINFAEVWNVVKQSKKMQSDPAKAAAGNTDPIEVLELRHRHHLRPLTGLENGTQIQNVPRGIFGFSMCGVPSLSAKRDNAAVLEIHKHPDGIVYYVGYAPEDDIEKYLARKNNFHILTSPYPGDKTSVLFEIPIDFVAKCEARPVKDSYVFDLFVSAIPELSS